MTSASIASFSPTILTTLGWTAIDAQLVEIPIWWSGVVAELSATYPVVNLISANVFISKQSPRYPAAFGTGLGMTLLGLTLCMTTVVVYTVHNRRLEANLAGKSAEDAGLDDQVHYKLML